MMRYKYLEVKFHDNDFGTQVMEALKRLWRFMYDNNMHHGTGSSHYSDRNVADMFYELHKAGSLMVILNRAIDAENLWWDVEFSTRGLRWLNVDWDRKKNDIREFKSITNEYLKIELEFHHNKEFMNEWQNAEHAYLNLKTGEAGFF